MGKALGIVFGNLFQEGWAIILIVIILIASLIAGLSWRKFFKTAEKEWKDFKDQK